MVTALAVLPGCGGIVVFGAPEEDGGGGAGGGSTIDVTSTAVGGAGAGPAGPIVPTIVEVSLGADCMPAVSPDPIKGGIVVRYENTGAIDGSIDLVQADLGFANPMEAWSFPLELVPPSSGLVPGLTTETIAHEKGPTIGDASFVCSLCGLEGTISLRYVAANGSETTVFAPALLSCAF